MPYGTIDGQINAQTANQPSAGTTTTSTTLVSSGLGVTVGSNYTGRYLVTANLFVSHSVIDTAVNVAIFRVSGGAIPANAAATTGSGIQGGQAVSPSASGVVSASISVLDSPGIGTFSYYVAYAANAAGTATLQGTLGGITATSSITAVEI